MGQLDCHNRGNYQNCRDCAPILNFGDHSILAILGNQRLARFAVPTTCSLRKLVEPVVVLVPATMAMTSPGLAALLFSKWRSALTTISSELPADFDNTGRTPHSRFKRAP